MSNDGRMSLLRSGTGAAYIRVSTDQQDTQRQYDNVRAFEKQNGVTIKPDNWFKDEGWARDTADKRPDFQRLMKLAEAGRVRWIVVDQLDRFGTKNAKQLITYLHRLDEAGCKLYDATGREWTGEDIATIITAVVEGEKSKGEQTSKSHRVLGGKIAKARLGEWQGGPVRLGFDVVCYQRETDKELWRVVYEGRDKRVKVYPDGRSERFDGEKNFPQSQPLTEVLRVAPSRDRAKIKAAVSVFKRYATESISFTALAHYLNELGFRSSYDGKFQGHHVGCMLADPIYLGYYTWNRTHHGKFHRYTNGQAVPELNYEEKVSRNDRADWVQSRRLFEPLVDQRTWDAVQRKLEGRSRRAKAPRSAATYLSGLLYCGNCGVRMVVGPGRPHYYCGTYHRHARLKSLESCKCLRNAVFQETLEGFVSRFLDETGRRLEILTSELDPATAKLEEKESEAWGKFREGLRRILAYLAENHLDEYVWAMSGNDPGRGLRDPEEYVEQVLVLYRQHYDPKATEAELKRLEEEHSALMRRYADLPTPRAKEKAAAELAALEARISEAERQREDVAGVVEGLHREMLDLRSAIESAKTAMRSETGERALRQRAEAIRGIVQRIECSFTATGKKGGGPGRANARLAAVTIYPVTGDAAEFPGESDVLHRDRVVSRW
jgi:DNA invertase Pin-like site-specific DNA recombinase